MTKELEAKTEDISKLLYEVYDVPSGICEYIDEVLQRLEAIDNTNPSEALDKLDEIIDYYNEPQYDVCESSYPNEFKEMWEKEINTIKQALIQAEIDKKQLELYIQENTKLFSNLVNKSKKELAWDIAVKKNVDIALLKREKSVDSYNFVASLSPMKRDELTEEEFNLLKEVE